MKGKPLITLITALCLAACLAAPGAAFAAEKAGKAGDDDRGKGHISTDVKVFQAGKDDMEMEAQASYPDKLDPRGDAWYSSHIKVRDQADTELCWAFSASAAAQISYLKQKGTDMGQLSPAHLGYFLYNRVDDPLGGTPRDKNLVTGQSKDKDYNDWRDEGGSAAWTFQHLATQSGLGAETATPFITKMNTSASGVKYTTYDGPAEYDKSLAYGHNQLIEKNSVYYSRLKYNETDRNKVKALLQKYGAVVVSVQFEPDFYLNEDTSAYYKFDPYEKNNHEVTIVGWDDNYSKDNFGSRTVSRKKGGKKTEKPSKDGAWIVMNSWGGEDLWQDGDGGYFYVSYESKDILSDGILALDMEVPKENGYCFQYDGNAYQEYLTPAAKDKAANVFTVPADKQMKLTDVAFTSWTSGEVKYTVDVYVDPAGSDGAATVLKTNPEAGIKAATMEVSTDTPGYKTFPLEKAVALDPGDSYSIVVSFKDKNGFGVETNRKAFAAGFEKQQSFFYDSDKGKWSDLYDFKTRCCARIKGLAELATCEHSYGAGQTVPAAKGLAGYTMEQCSLCGHMKETEVTPALDPVPNKTKIKSLTAGSKKLTVKWKKSSELIAGQNVDGYKVRYSTKASMKGAKAVKAAGYTTVSKKIKSLKSGKKYYLQVAPYYKDAAGKVWTGDWSKAKSVKVK